MNNKDFISSATDFIDWLLDALDRSGFYHQWRWDSTRQDCNYRKGDVWNCTSLFNAYEQYVWHAKIATLDDNCYFSDSRTTICSFTETENYFNHLRQCLEVAINYNQPSSCLSCCKEILNWGIGTDERIRQRRIASDIRNVVNENLHNYLREVMNYFGNPHLTTTSSFKYGNINRLQMDSGTTKIFSLVCDNFVIYDGRVGAALGYLVRCWALDVKQQVPTCLRFRWGGSDTRNSRTLPIVEQKRNPNPIVQNSAHTLQRNGHSIFPRIGPRTNRLQWNIYANWLCQELLRRDGKRPVEEQSRFSTNIANGGTRLHAFEAALFMIGYCVNHLKFPDTQKQDNPWNICNNQGATK